jgi:NAD+ kinase
MRNFFLIANPSKEGTLEMANEISGYLHDKGAVCAMTAPQMTTDTYTIPEGTECAIILGGDGTLIRAAKNLYSRKIPILGINMGTMGYLTQITKEEQLPPVLDALIDDNFRLEYRMMLEAELLSEKGQEIPGQNGIALNEVVISRDGGMQPIHFDLYVNGKFLNAYNADGIIIATPTGSTAYNLSAGGPIVTPGAQLMVVTPICSHALNSRSIVLNGSDEVDIYVEWQENQHRIAVFDGERELSLDEHRHLQVRRSEHETTMIRLKDISFLDNLRNKMTRI